MNTALLFLLAAGPVFVADDPRPPSIQVTGEGEDGLVLGPKGLPLYTFDGLERGESCSLSPCRDHWKLVEAASTDKPVGEWTLKSGFEGYGQVWLFRRLPVFTFAGDARGGRATGDGTAGDWHAVRYIGPLPRVSVPPGVKPVRSGAGFILADHLGRTLYTFARDSAKPACNGECLDVWPPLLAPALAAAIGDWTVIERPDGLRQWAYGGRLVYRFSEDPASGTTNGAGLGGVWNTISIGSGKAKSPPGTATSEAPHAQELGGKGA